MTFPPPHFGLNRCCGAILDFGFLWATGQSGSNRVKRGGSFNNSATNLRAANRNNNTPSNQNDNLGFRCASSRRCLRIVSKDAIPARLPVTTARCPVPA